MEGKVKFYDDIKGFGFIVGDDEKEYFVHRSGIKSGTLNDDVSVTFTPTEGDRGPKAEDVEVVAGSEDSKEEDSEALDLTAAE